MHYPNRRNTRSHVGLTIDYYCSRFSVDRAREHACSAAPPANNVGARILRHTSRAAVLKMRYAYPLGVQSTVYRGYECGQQTICEFK